MGFRLIERNPMETKRVKRYCWVDARLWKWSAWMRI